MPSIRPTQQNEVLARIAQALNRTRGFLNPAEGTPLSGVSWFRPGDWLMGNSPEEVREWSYGNAPFAQKPLGDLLPQAKRTEWERMDTGERERVNRAGSSLDTLLAAPGEALARGAAVGIPMAVGAIRSKGVPGAVASHTISSSKLGQYADDISRDGLFAPSIGLTYQNRSDYRGHNPHIVFKADALDRPFEDQAPPGIWNRDAYVWNPDVDLYNMDPKGYSVEKQWLTRGNKDNRLVKAWNDARLTQMEPGGSHTASIMASPRFGSLKEWEDNSRGLGSLMDFRKDMDKQPDSLSNYEWEWQQLMRNLGIQDNEGPQIKDILEVFPQLRGLADKMPGAINPTAPASQLFDLAQNAPSAMGEMKIYAPHVPAGPDAARIYLPGESGLRNPLEGLGYDVWNRHQLGNYAQDVMGIKDGERRIDLLAPNREGYMPRPSEFDVRRGLMVGAPGLKPPKPAASLDSVWNPNTQSWADEDVDLGFDTLPDPATDIGAIAAHEKAQVEAFLDKHNPSWKKPLNADGTPIDLLSGFDKPSLTETFKPWMNSGPFSGNGNALTSPTNAENVAEDIASTQKPILDMLIDEYGFTPDVAKQIESDAGAGMPLYKAINKAAGFDTLSGFDKPMPSQFKLLEPVTEQWAVDNIILGSDGIVPNLQKHLKISEGLAEQIEQDWLQGDVGIYEVINKYGGFK